MRIVFAGSPEFAAAVLAGVLEAAPQAGWSVPLVLTQPDRPSGRGMKATPSAVKRLAIEHGIPVEAPASLSKGEAAGIARERLRAAQPDLLAVAAYGLILPVDVLQIPAGLRRDWHSALTAINVHASLLPRWRGAAPIVRAIEAGDTTTGITIMQMDAGLDTGPMLLSEAVAIEPFDTAGTLTARLALLGARLLVQALQEVGRLTATLQPTQATYARKVEKSEAWLDWSSSAELLERRLRAFDPFPVATTELRGTPLRLWRGRVVAGAAPVEAPGTVIDTGPDGIVVACGSGALSITELQRAGGRRLPAAEFVRGFPVNAGDRFMRPESP